MKKLLLLLAPLLLVAACAGGTQRSDDDHNDADVSFAQQMIPHHQQAVYMAELAAGAQAGADVTTLAAQIEAAQDPEIATMRGFLKDWGLNEMSGDAGGHDMDGMAMGDGMASDDDLEALANLQGEAFDQTFLRLMTAHHEGAIAMAKTEIAEGKNADAKQLAQQIIDAQEREITTMKGLQP